MAFKPHFLVAMVAVAAVYVVTLLEVNITRLPGTGLCFFIVAICGGFDFRISEDLSKIASLRLGNVAFLWLIVFFVRFLVATKADDAIASLFRDNQSSHLETYRFWVAVFVVTMLAVVIANYLMQSTTPVFSPRTTAVVLLAGAIAVAFHLAVNNTLHLSGVPPVQVLRKIQSLAAVTFAGVALVAVVAKFGK